jgi:hypothetical protein
VGGNGAVGGGVAASQSHCMQLGGLPVDFDWRTGSGTTSGGIGNGGVGLDFSVVCAGASARVLLARVPLPSHIAAPAPITAFAADAFAVTATATGRSVE